MTKNSSAKTSRAIYAGTFDPITNGHKDILQRALNIFDEIVVAVAASTQKKTLFSVEERTTLVRESLTEYASRVQVLSFDGLLVQFAREKGIHVLIRGLRAVSDYDYEAQIATLNRSLANDIETVFLLTTNRSSFISSSIVKEVARNAGDVSELVPPNVAAKLKAVFRK